MKASPLKTLEIHHFRNLNSLQLEFHPRFNFFLGDNAQGKTSILEAIYFLSELHSFRTKDVFSLIQHETSLATLDASMEYSGLENELKIRIFPDRKEVFLNGKSPRPLRLLRQRLPVILFTPDSVQLFRASPSERRSYFDRYFGLISDSYFQDSHEYARILKQKYRLLEQVRMGRSGPWKEEWEIWNTKLVQVGAKIIVERFLQTSHLSKKFSPFFKTLSHEDWEATLVYQPYISSLQQTQNVPEVEKLLWEESLRRKEEEIERNQVLVGPHRDDWNLLLGTVRLKEEGSQGQHRIAVAALKLAELKLMTLQEMRPLALFDDLLSELDQSRNQAVLDQLAKSCTQVFLTSTTPYGVKVKELDGFVFPMERGQILK